MDNLAKASLILLALMGSAYMATMIYDRFAAECVAFPIPMPPGTNL